MHMFNRFETQMCRMTFVKTIVIGDEDIYWIVRYHGYPASNQPQANTSLKYIYHLHFNPHPEHPQL